MTDPVPAPEDFLDPDYVSPTFAKASRVEWEMLWCDQGMANLIKVYRDGAPATEGPAAVILADFGTDVYAKTQIDGAETVAPPIKTIINAIKDRGYLIDMVIVSHQDKDHWQLLIKLLAAIEEINLKSPQPVALTIGKLFRGGKLYGPKATAAMKALEAKTSEASCVWTTLASSYGEARSDITSFAKYGTVSFRLLTVNGPSAVGATGASIIKNASSAVVVVDMVTQCFVLPGDATWHTFLDVNAKLDRWKTTFKNPALSNCAALSAPHHGSFTTSIRKRTTPIRGLDKTVFEPTEEFLEKIAARRVGVSAGEKQKYGHPDSYMIALFKKYAIATGSSVDIHTIVQSNRVDTKNTFETVTCGQQVFTSIYDLGPPQAVADWVFTADLIRNTVNVKKYKITNAQTYRTLATWRRAANLTKRKQQTAQNAQGMNKRRKFVPPANPGQPGGPGQVGYAGRTERAIPGNGLFRAHRDDGAP